MKVYQMGDTLTGPVISLNEPVMKKDKENAGLEEYSIRLASSSSICLRRVYRLTYDDDQSE